LSERPHLVVIGGGFAGLTLARALRNEPVRITLVDRRNHHLFQPLLYQVATAALAPGDIAEPIRRILKGQANVQVRLAEATGVDLEGRRVLLANGDIPYDKLVVATGATHHYFGHSEWAEDAPGLKTIGDALEIRRRLLMAFERAEWAETPEERRRLLTFVVVGAGPTGVELAGAVKEIALKTMLREFRTIHPERDTRVLLVEASPRILGSFAAPLPARAREQLERLGVEIRLGEPVSAVDDTSVTVGDEIIPTCTVLWAAGVAASPLGAALGAERDRAGRVRVGETLSLPDHPEVYVLGDLAWFEQDGKPLPGVAPVAIQQARALAANLRRERRGKLAKPFRYVDQGSLATIGRSKAVADLGFVRLSGYIAWLAWVFVHLMTLVGFRNRLVVFVKWTWAWFTFEGSSRLVWQGESDEPWNEVPGGRKARDGESPREVA
jgi:NADH dehydrogenase